MNEVHIHTSLIMHEDPSRYPHLSTSSVSSFTPLSIPIRLLSGSLRFSCFPETFVAHKYVYVCRTQSPVQACSQMFDGSARREYRTLGDEGGRDWGLRSGQTRATANDFPDPASQMWCSSDLVEWRWDLSSK